MCVCVVVFWNCQVSNKSNTDATHNTQHNKQWRELSRQRAPPTLTKLHAQPEAIDAAHRALISERAVSVGGRGGVGAVLATGSGGVLDFFYGGDRGVCRDLGSLVF